MKSIMFIKIFADKPYTFITSSQILLNASHAGCSRVNAKRRSQSPAVQAPNAKDCNFNDIGTSHTYALDREPRPAF